MLGSGRGYDDECRLQTPSPKSSQLHRPTLQVCIAQGTMMDTLLVLGLAAWEIVGPFVKDLAVVVVAIVVLFWLAYALKHVFFDEFFDDVSDKLRGAASDLASIRIELEHLNKRISEELDWWSTDKQGSTFAKQILSRLNDIDRNTSGAINAVERISDELSGATNAVERISEELDWFSSDKGSTFAKQILSRLNDIDKNTSR
jgi:hypothetical protein